MKKNNLAPVLLLIIVTRCSCPSDNPVEGTWDMQYGEWSNPDTTFIFKKTDSNQQVKVFENNHYVWLQQDLNADSTNLDFMVGGFGTYTISGDTVFEVLSLSPWPDVHGKSLSTKIEVRGDSLIQLIPYPGVTPEFWEDWTGKEIYIRMN